MPSVGTIRLACRPEKGAPVEDSQYLSWLGSWINRKSIYKDKFVLVVFHPLEHFKMLAQLMIALCLVSHRNTALKAYCTSGKTSVEESEMVSRV